MPCHSTFSRSSEAPLRAGAGLYKIAHFDVRREKYCRAAVDRSDFDMILQVLNDAEMTRPSEPVAQQQQQIQPKKES
jgi:hypothetical protein